MQQETTNELQQLILDAQAGNVAAFTSLVDQHYDQMYRYALRFCGQVSDAEDITQQACMKLARTIGQFRFEAAFSTWLYRLVTNCAKDWLKAASNRQHEPLEEADSGIVTESSTSEIHLEQVLKQVDTFGEGFREAVLLVLGEGLSHKETAEVLGVKESTVSWRIHETRKRLAQMEARS
jgi:RNA polymerase sigma-70 factor (ECF subfamily)